MTLKSPPALTLDEKAALTSGANFWSTKAIGEIPAVMVSDGPHGLRKQISDEMSADERPGDVLPAGGGLAQSWDAELIGRVGVALGEECRVEGVAVLLGPGVNIKRPPLGGRNFEYFSEDPYLSGRAGRRDGRGIQSQQVGGCVKHFAANNPEMTGCGSAPTPRRGRCARSTCAPSSGS